MSFLQYNTKRNHLLLREYGRHVQRMVEHLKTIEDRTKRNEQAKVVIEMMGILNPHLKNVEDFRHMLWDHLFAISDFTLDVDSPYPIPQKETYKQKTAPPPYPRRYPKYAHLGKNLEIVIDKAMKEEDAEKKAGFANAIAHYMKLSYSNWHKELVHDEAIRSELNNITGGELEFGSTPFIKHRNQNFERDDYGTGRNNRRANFRNNNNRNGSNRNGGSQRNNNFRNGGGSNNNGRNNNNRNFKKRY